MREEAWANLASPSMAGLIATYQDIPGGLPGLKGLLVAKKSSKNFLGGLWKGQIRTYRGGVET
jgi:hypothetical protein